MTAKTTATGLPRRLLAALIASSAFAALALAGPASALAAPVLQLSLSHQLPTVPVGGYVQYEAAVANTGTSPTSGKITVAFTLPVGLKVTSATDEIKKATGIAAWTCTTAPDRQSVSCEGPSLAVGRPIPAGQEACLSGGFEMTCHILLVAQAEAGLALGTILTPTVTACGGGATTCPTVGASASDPTEIVERPVFALTGFDGQVLQENGDPATQAGSHPYSAGTEFFFTHVMDQVGLIWATQDLKDATVKLPPGLVGNPRSAPQCTEQQLVAETDAQCPPESQVGIITLWVDGLSTGAGKPPDPVPIPVYNMIPSHGTPGLFGFNVSGVATHIYATLRTGEDYGLTVTSRNAPEPIPFEGVTFDFWGVPADSGHDSEREGLGCENGCPSAEAADPKPFISLPTSCVGPVETFLDVTGWQGGSDGLSFFSHDNSEPSTPIGAEGCSAVDFSPKIEARPTTNVADAASGLDVDLQIPQHENCDPGPPVSCETAEANLKDTTVALPEGLVVNPSGANGLGACTEAQFGFTGKEGDTIHTTPDPATCPDAARLGRVEVDSPLLDHPLNGSVFIAQPYANPFNSLLALYIALDDPQTGIVVKLAGEVHANPTTGQLTTTVLHNPQLPFEDFKLHFFGGAGGALRTPAVCGTYQTASNLVPWTAPEGQPASPRDFWAIERSPNGGTCPTTAGAEPNKPDLDAGTVSPIAGTFSPMVINLRREDGTQQFSTVTLTPPPGLLGKLAGTPYCPEAALAAAAQKTGNQEKANPSCPAASQIGTVDVAAGAGPAPYNAPGRVYLTGPYKGAPIGLAIVTPATAGPFDLGTVVVRTALLIDPATAQITAVSDPIPAILQGIPLDVRSALIHLDKPSFTLNPTSCDPLAFSGSLLSTLNQAAPLSERFQVGECGRLPFKPKLGLRLKGGTKRGAHPALTATLTMPEGSANIARASVTLPHSEFLDQAHIGTVCTRVQYAASQCPAASVYGQATAYSPLLDAPLTGPVYLRSSDNKLPDLVASLGGQIHIDLDGRIDSVKGGIRTSFEAVPDAAVSKFVLAMQGGHGGLLQNSTNICLAKNRATALFDAHNGKAADLAPALRAKCRKAHKRHRRHHRAARLTAR